MKKIMVKKGNVYKNKYELESKDWVVLTIIMALIDFIVFCILF